MSLRLYDPYFWHNKIDPLTDIRNMGIITAGDVYWVSKVTDSDHTARIDALGRKIVKVDVQSAVDATVNDQNDYILTVPGDGGTAISVGTAIDLNKDRVHLLGLGYTKAIRGYTSTIQDSMGTVPDTEVLAVTGDGVEVGGLRFVGTLGTNDGGTMSNGVLFLGTSAHGFWAHDSVFESSMNVWGTPPVVRGQGTAANDVRFDNCAFAQTGTGNVEAAANSGLVLSGAGNKRWTFNDCEFSMSAGSTTETLFTPGINSETTRLIRCFFRNVNGTAFAITSAIRGSVTANHPVILKDCWGIGFTQMGTDPNVFKTPTASGTRALVYDSGLAIGSAMLVAA